MYRYRCLGGQYSAVANAARAKKMKVEEFPHSLNLTGPESDLRIQVRTDPRYESFIASAALREILGYKLKVASVENVLKGKVWAYVDDTRRRSKRQKDLADIFRIIETYPELTKDLPQQLRERLSEKK
jgi:hypothetical protein